MTKNNEFVKFDKVDKSYDGKVLVVKDLNLDIAEGEFITMLGPSGSGKTTCLMMLAGFETPTNGEIYLRWKSNFKYSTSQKRYRNGISKLCVISTYDGL
tara:strand:- start:595 stop:891 length:297 start_codon:yes stop_codon:yes gene_type:complete